MLQWSSINHHRPRIHSHLHLQYTQQVSIQHWRVFNVWTYLYLQKRITTLTYIITTIPTRLILFSWTPIPPHRMSKVSSCRSWWKAFIRTNSAQDVVFVASLLSFYNNVEYSYIPTGRIMLIHTYFSGGKKIRILRFPMHTRVHVKAERTLYR